MSKTIQRLTAVAFVASLIITATSVCQAQDADQAASAKRAQEMDQKIAALQNEFKVLATKWTEATDQAKTNAAAELEVAKGKLEKTQKERRAAYDSYLGDLKTSMDSAWKQFEQERDKGKAIIDENFENLRGQWNEAWQRAQKAHAENVAYLSAEMDRIETQAKSASAEAREDWVARRAAARKQYLENSQQLRASYQSHIQSMNKEIDQLRAAAQLSRDQTRAKIEQGADQLSQKMNAAYEEMLAGYQAVSKKADAYMAETKSRMQQADAETQLKIRNEINQVSKAVCDMRAEAAHHWQHYCDELDQEVAHCEQRIAAADARAKSRMNEMAEEARARRDKANKKLQKAQQACVDAINTDIDNMKAAMEAADERERARLIAAIDKRQAELEDVKQQLKKSDQ